ncbi:unnamed protein product, partial [Meganyctiphanes norvegica]
MYSVGSTPTAICAIVCMTEEGKENDYGYPDYEASKKLWESVGCTVRGIPNPTEEELKRNLSEIKKDINDKHDYFIFEFIGHGGKKDKEYLRLKDEEEITVAEIRDIFSNKNLPALCGKPKLFFIQACRGRNKEQLYRAATDAASVAGTSATTYSDMFTLYASISDHVSWFSSTSGSSRFISALCEVVRRDFKYHDIKKMATTVSAEVAKGNTDKYAQSIQEVSTLIKEFHFVSPSEANTCFCMCMGRLFICMRKDKLADVNK